MECRISPFDPIWLYRLGASTPIFSANSRIELAVNPLARNKAAAVSFMSSLRVPLFIVRILATIKF